MWPIPVLTGLLVAAAVAAVSFVLPLTGRETAEPETISPSPSPVSTQSGEQAQESQLPQEPSIEPTDSQNEKETPQESQPQQETSAPLTQEEQAQLLLENMSLREKVLQMFVVTPEQLTGISGTVTVAGETTRAALEEYPVGGIVYFAKNLRTPDQVRQLLANVQDMAPLGLFLSVDEEGGTVARMGHNSAMGMTQFPEMGEIETAAMAYYVGNTIGSELGEYGFNLDFAPVADVNSNPNNPVIGTRAFSSDPQTAAELVSACVEGFLDSGTLCTLKHFPGHGDTDTDSHSGAAVSEKTLEELEECELIPFQSGIDAVADFVMVSHISLPAVTGDMTPASLSYEITTVLLRDQLGFDGLAITDSMTMQAITDSYSADEAAVQAVQAGIDIILMPEDLDTAVQGILSAVADGTITEQRIDESVLRILQVKLEQGILTLE
ncbi:MAG: glycoside hydrolase family 3 protein [Oscillospiraceae bacterium]|nr:glycoside hydrolase family 3 protein [Oscillospiraceae bacterium]